MKLHNYLRLQTEAIPGFFQFTQLGTNYRTEVLAGVTTLLPVGFITYPLVKAFQGKVSEISAASRVLAALSVLYFGLVN